MEFSDRLLSAVRSKNSRLLVGIDPHLDLLPPQLLSGVNPSDRTEVAAAVLKFCMGILEAVSDIAPAVKPQVAFFERLGPPGYDALEKVVLAAKQHGLVVISDCKRGDIGSTATAYAEYHLGSSAENIVGLGADAVTVSPYLGADSLAPFARFLESGRGIFVLVKTSNKGSADLQDRHMSDEMAGLPMYYASAKLAQSLADSHVIGDFGYSSVGIVVGATFPKEAAALREAFPELLFLVPGVGAQGASPTDIRCCFDENGLGALVNASRSVIFAYRDSPGGVSWQEAARTAALNLRDELNAVL